MTLITASQYPKYGKDNDGVTKTIRKYASRTEIEEALKSAVIGSFDDEGYELKAAETEPNESGSLWYIDYKYGVKSEDSDTGALVDEVELDTNALEKPLETHTKYKTKWNYALAASYGTTSIPSWADTATGTAIGGDDGEKYKWIKSPSDVPEGWSVIQDKTKPGVESYIVPSPVINERKYYNGLHEALNVAKAVGKISNPKMGTCGLTGYQWLVMSSRLRKEKKKYVVEAVYQGATSWDEELYS